MLLAVVLSTLTTTSFLFAQGTTQLVASAVLDAPPSEDDGPRSRGPRRAVTTPARDLTAMGRAILERNIFDSQTGSISWDPPPPPAPETPEEEEIAPVVDGDPNTAPPCEGSIRLVASYYRPNEPDQSFAAITNATGTSLLYAVGMRVDEREVVAIGRSRVVLRPSGQPLCSLSMFAEQPVASAPRAQPAEPVVVATPEAATPGSPGIETSELDSNIQQISETSYAINRTLVDRLLANQAELMRTARVIPHEVDGRVVGVKIYGIRRSSLLGRLGVQNGDMLRTINGFDLTEPDSVLEAYTRLRSADRLTLSIERRGQPVTMDYQIR
ncbi:type II secretion system protein GspC [Sandaracinus amylolyticus]|uniref:type II secretion system protein GspC n=1 Tax=Sandaracinus amylolyticus TaxID=927083 RepID=UPI001F2DD89E|nr:type II secretion system protein GspC [Sandaracinus amylolyticus]UJR83562.1 Hypothetical protein I5071_56300 [Sandaracinus amylolyticus]